MWRKTLNLSRPGAKTSGDLKIYAQLTHEALRGKDLGISKTHIYWETKLEIAGE